MRLHFYLLILSYFLSSNLVAQDSLPIFSVKKAGTRNIISWKNKYHTPIANINIQRSLDSLRNFSTIASMLDPMNESNGYVDSKSPSNKIFYRIFIAFEGGSYVFTKSMQPSMELIVPKKNDPTEEKKITDTLEIISLRKRDTLQLKIPGKLTVKIKVPDIEEYHPPKPAVRMFTPSKYIYTGKDNNVIIQLPDSAFKNYHVVFYDEKESKLFSLKITEPLLTLEKMNFERDGWYYFQLFRNNQLLEKCKFYLPKEGKNGIPLNDPGRILRENEY